MKTKRIVALVGILMLIAFATSAAITEKSIIVKVENYAGVPVSGALVSARLVVVSPATQPPPLPCKDGGRTVSGKCTIDKVTIGKKWTFVARDANGKVGTKTVTILSSMTMVTVTIPKIP